MAASLEYRLGQLARAIQCSLDPSLAGSSSSSLSSTSSGGPAAFSSEEAQRFVGEVQRAPDGWTFFLELFTRCAAAGAQQSDVAFVCLGRLTEIVQAVAQPRTPQQLLLQRQLLIQQQQQQQQQQEQHSQQHQATVLTPIRSVILRWLQAHVAAGTLAHQPGFLRTKIAVLFALLVKAQYPAVWSDPFAFLFGMVGAGAMPQGSSSQNPIPHPAAAFEMFLCIMKACMDEIVAYDQLRSADEIARNVEVKRRMRAEHVVPQMIQCWLGALNQYKLSNPALCTTCLECMREWIGWAPLDKVTTDQFLGVLFECLSAGGGKAQRVRLGACACLEELADKGMGTCERLFLLRRLKIVEIVAQFGVPGNYGNANNSGSGNGGGHHIAHINNNCLRSNAPLTRESIAATAVVSDDEVDFAEALASLLNAVTFRLVVCRDVLLGLSKDEGGAGHHRNGSAQPGLPAPPPTAAVAQAEAAAVCDALLSRAIEVLWGFFGHSGSSYEVSEECLASLSAALKTLAREVSNRVPNPQASQIRLVSLVPRFLSILATKIAYPPSYTHGQVEDCEDDAHFDAYRDSLCSMFMNAARACPQMAATFVMERAKSLFIVDHPRRLQSASMEEIEATLLLVLHVRAGASTFSSRPEFTSMVHGIHRSGISAHPHAAVLLQYFDMTVKYHACLAGHPPELGIVLQALTGALRNEASSPTVRAQCCFHLRNICKLLQHTLRAHSSYVRTILQAVHPLLVVPLPGHDEAGGTASGADRASPSGAGAGGFGRSSGTGNNVIGGTAQDSKTSSKGNPYIQNDAKNKVTRHDDPSFNILSARGAVPLAFADRLHLFDLCGLLISRCVEDTQVEPLMRTLMAPLLERLAGGKQGLYAMCMGAGHSAAPSAEAAGDYFARCIKAVGFVTKTFPPTVEAPVREIFRVALESAGAALSGLPAHGKVRAQCIFLLHRMVACLGPHLIPYLPASLPSLISTTNTANALETFQLINQFVAKYPRPMSTVMIPLFVPIVQKLFSVMPQGWTPRGADTTGAPTNAQVLAESLLNVFVLFIQNIVCNNMATTVLLDRQAALPFLPQVLGSLLQACRSVPDPVLVKSVFMIFRNLARAWIEMGQSGGSTKEGSRGIELGGGCRGKGADPNMAITAPPPPPAEVRTVFAKFVTEEATLTGLNVCVRFGYDPSDAAHTITMHKEFLKLQRTVAGPQCCGEAYVKFVVERYIGATLGCGPALCVEYAHHLRGGTPLRAFGKFFAKMVQGPGAKPKK